MFHAQLHDMLIKIKNLLVNDHIILISQTFKAQMTPHRAVSAQDSIESQQKHTFEPLHTCGTSFSSLIGIEKFSK